MFNIGRKPFFVIVFFALLASACSKGSSTIEEPPPPPPLAPVADFSYTVGFVPYQSTVAFTNTSKNGETYFWDFGDNSTSTQENPQHFYQTGGTFTVKLTAKGPGGEHTAEKTITLSAPYTTAVLSRIVFEDYWPLTVYDFGSYPDVYVVVTNGTSVLSSKGVVQYNDLPNKTPASWTFNNKYLISPLTKKINIAFWDADEPGDPDDLIYQFDFIPIDYTTGSNPFPNKITKGDTYIEVSWE